MSSLLADGDELDVDARVMREHALQFRQLPGRLHTRAVVLHWTGGQGLASQVYRTLVSRRLSVHLVIEPDGTVHQMADLGRRCAHAGTVDDSDGDGKVLSANAHTVGIEIVNPASEFPASEREMTTETIHGKAARATGFTAAQTAAVLAVVPAICAHYELPLVVPTVGGDVLSTVLAERDFAAFRGVLGHLHLTRRKRDPGLALLRAVMASRSSRGT